MCTIIWYTSGCPSAYSYIYTCIYVYMFICSTDGLPERLFVAQVVKLRLQSKAHQAR